MSIMHAEPEMLAATAGELQSINAVARPEMQRWRARRRVWFRPPLIWCPC